MTFVFGFHIDQVVSSLVSYRRVIDSDGVGFDDCERRSTTECFLRD